MFTPLNTGFEFIAAIALIGGLLKWSEDNATGVASKVFNVIPAVVFLYLISMLLTTFGFWDIKAPEIKYMRSLSGFRGLLLPALIFLMLLKADLRLIAKLGPKMLIAFFSASITIGIGFIVMFAIMKNGFVPAGLSVAEHAEKMQTVVGTFSALSGSWIGGSANMAAVQGALKIPDTAMTNVLVIDNINYAIWIMLLLAFVRFAHKFNVFTKADTSKLEEVTAHLETNQASNEKITMSSLLFLLGLALAVGTLSIWLSPKISAVMSEWLPPFLKDFASKTTWLVLLATILGVVCAMTPIGKIAGSAELGNIMLFIVIGLIASGASLSELKEAPYYVLAGFVILLVHLVLMVVVAKIFKLDLFTCSVASVANIGAVASAPIIAAAYDKSLVSIGVLMGLLGYIVGTIGGLIVSRFLYLLS